MKRFKIRNKLLLLAGVIASVIAAALSFTPTYATDNYIQISPTNEDFELEPGQTYTGSVRVQNIGENKFDYKMSAQPFTYSDDNDYSVSVGAMGKNSTFFDITGWVTFSKDSGSLDPHTKETIDYTIKVPKDAPAGGQYMAIVAALEENKNDAANGTSIKVISQVADLIFAKVNGETNNCAKILNESINTFMFEPPITTSSLVENCGNVHMYATYTVKVYPLFSDKTIFDNEDKPDTHVIIPDTRRYNSVAWDKDKGAPMFGIFNVEQTVKVGKESSTIKKLVIICPLWLIIIIILLIAAIVFRIVMSARKRHEDQRSNVNNNNAE